MQKLAGPFQEPLISVLGTNHAGAERDPNRLKIAGKATRGHTRNFPGAAGLLCARGKPNSGPIPATPAGSDASGSFSLSEKVGIQLLSLRHAFMNFSDLGQGQISRPQRDPDARRVASALGSFFVQGSIRRG